MYALGRLAVLVLLALLAAPASASALPATGARIAQHPGFVRVVVDFSGGTLEINEADATDPSPGDGTARVAYRVSTAQTGTLEAVADSAKDGSLVCLVQVRVGLNP